MTDRPILFSGAMVRALVARAKRQTRRALKFQDELSQAYRPIVRGNAVYNYSGTDLIERAKYQVGDRLWVRESGVTLFDSLTKRIVGFRYAADQSLTVDESHAHDGASFLAKSTPSIHMRRAFSRLTLPVTDVRIERLQDISAADALAEGIPKSANEFTIDCATPDPREAFAELWRSVNGPDSWAANPWVAAVSFDVIHRNIDEVTK